MSINEVKTKQESVLIVPFDVYSHYLKSARLAEAISDKYTVIFRASSEDRSNSYIRSLGYQLEEIKRIDGRDTIEKLSKLDHSWLAAENIEPVFLDLVRALNKLKPKVVINDCSIVTRMACEYTNTKNFSIIIGHLCTYFGINRRPPEIHPAVKLFRAFGISQGLIAAISRIVQPFVLKNMVSDLQKLRKKYGLPATKSYFEEYEGSYNLITDLPEIAPMRTLPKNFQYVGPVYNNQDDPKLTYSVSLTRRKKLFSLP